MYLWNISFLKIIYILFFMFVWTFTSCTVGFFNRFGQAEDRNIILRFHENPISYIPIQAVKYNPKMHEILVVPFYFHYLQHTFTYYIA